VCEYEINQLTNDKDYRNPNVNANDIVAKEQCQMSRSSEGQCHNACL